MVFNNAVNANSSGFQSLTTAGVWNGRTLTAGSGITISNGDGISGNPTISATGGFDPSTTSYFFDDFLCIGYSDVDVPLLNWQSDGATDMNPPGSGEASHPGICQLTSAGTDAYLHGANSTCGPFVLTGGTLTATFLMKASALSTAGEAYTLYLGLFDAISTPAATTAGLYFTYTHSANSGNWVINAEHANTVSTGNTSTALDTNWNKYTIVANSAGNSVAFYINGSQVANSPLTTNIPTTADQLAPAIYIDRTAGSASRTWKIDYFEYSYTGLSR